MQYADDEFVAELAVAAEADYIITFNRKDFKGIEKFGIAAILPSQFLTILREELLSAITITVPDSIYNKVKELAERDQSSVEQFAVLALAEKMSSIVTTDYLEKRANRAKPGRLRELLEKAPAVMPQEGDSLP